MKKHEAMSAMNEGKKITHLYFSPGEYVCLSEDFPISGEYLFEDGAKIHASEFWRARPDALWRDDWEIFKEK